MSLHPLVLTANTECKNASLLNKNCTAILSLAGAGAWGEEPLTAFSTVPWMTKKIILTRYGLGQRPESLPDKETIIVTILPHLSGNFRRVKSITQDLLFPSPRWMKSATCEGSVRPRRRGPTEPRGGAKLRYRKRCERPDPHPVPARPGGCLRGAHHARKPCL